MFCVRKSTVVQHQLQHKGEITAGWKSDFVLEFLFQETVCHTCSVI